MQVGVMVMASASLSITPTFCSHFMKYRKMSSSRPVVRRTVTEMMTICTMAARLLVPAKARTVKMMALAMRPTLVETRVLSQSLPLPVLFFILAKRWTFSRPPM